jgi:hypothetical protein
VSTQVEIIYSSGRNSKETGEIISISPRKSARGIRPLSNKRDNVQMSYISKSIMNIAKLTTTNFVAKTTRAEDVGVVAVGVVVVVVGS